MGCMTDRGPSEFCAKCGWREGTLPASPLQLPPRTILAGKYLLGRVLGQGGFGITYLAWDLNLEQRRAIKEYFPREVCGRGRDSRTVQPFTERTREAYQYGLANFLREGQILARFQGRPGIVSLLELFRENGTAYMVMVYLEGQTLEQVLEDRGGRISYDQACAILLPVMEALSGVHQEGLLHRDIKPGNVYVTQDGRGKLLDFGSARHAMGEQSQNLSAIVTAGYAPEEQHRRNGIQGPWTDVYALGATFYRAITGQRPPDSLDRLAQDDLVPPSRRGVKIRPGSEAALLKALAVRREDRFQTVTEFQTALMSSDIFEPKPVPPPELKPEAHRRVTRVTPEPVQPIKTERDPHRLLKRAAPALVAVVLVLAGAWMLSSISPKRGRLEVTANVAGAHISIDGQTQPDWVTPHIFKLRAGRHVVTGTKAGYEEASQNMTLQPGATGSVNLNLPPHQVGQLTVTANVVGAQITIDGQTQPDWVTPHTFASLPAARHRLTVTKEGCQAVNQDVSLQSGGDEHLTVDLRCAGQLTITANVSGAKILIDGQTQADWLTPHSFASLHAGPHRVTAQKDGYQTVSEGVTVQAGQDSSVTLNLPPIAQVGRLTVTASTAGGGAVAGASISIDGQTQVPSATPHTFDLPSGAHRITVTKAGYQAASRDVNLPAGGNLNLHFTLTNVLPDVSASKGPGGSTPTFDHGGSGMVKIITKPPGLQVFIDGELRGRSPLDIPNLPAGHHTYRIAGPPGREARDGTFDIQDGAYWERTANWE